MAPISSRSIARIAVAIVVRLRDERLAAPASTRVGARWRSRDRRRSDATGVPMNGPYSRRST